MKTKYTSIYFIISVMFFGCSEIDKSFQEPLPDNVTYNSHIKTILDRNCVRCHHGGSELKSTVNLSSYSNIVQLTTIIEPGNSNSYLLTSVVGLDGKMYEYLNNYREYELFYQWIVIDSVAEN